MMMLMARHGVGGELGKQCKVILKTVLKKKDELLINICFSSSPSSLYSFSRINFLFVKFSHSLLLLPFLLQPDIEEALPPLSLMLQLLIIAAANKLLKVSSLQ